MSQAVFCFMHLFLNSLLRQVAVLLEEDNFYHCHLSVMRIQEFVSIKNYNNNYYN